MHILDEIDATEPDIDPIGYGTKTNQVDADKKDLQSGDVPDEDEEELELEMLQELWKDDEDDDLYFDLYEHFGIPSGMPEYQQEGLLEAAMGSS